jgi:hypothetical protein
MSQERTAEEWGRVAVSLPGWRWMRGMSIPATEDNREALVDYPPSLLYVSEAGSDERGEVADGEDYPDPDDPATEGCMLRLLGRPLYAVEPRGPAWWVTLALLDHPDSDEDGLLQIRGSTVGRACIAAAEALGRWPGGAS